MRGTMQAQPETSNTFFIWGIDDSPYGPVELPVLVNWIKDERVLADTWIFSRKGGSWQRAADIAELKMFFKEKPAQPPAGTTTRALTPGSLRRIKILADLNDAQLEHLIDYMELQRVPQWSVVVRQGDPGDAMYLIMEGELRARVVIGDQEMILSTLGTGEFFGDISLFDHGPRSADVVANVDSSLIRISSTAFNRLTREAPALATPFLQATSRTLAARIRADNKRLGQMKQQFSAGGRG
jgi:CRP-like cAMP-binding protein